MPGARLPNFLIIGAAKAGSTSLYQYLRSHPDVFMPGHKELRFFIGNTDGENGRWHLGRGWYEEQFASANGAVAVGEATPSYTLYPHHLGVAERMASVVPEARLIYIVREPVDRMVSHYMHNFVSGVERKPLEVALRERPVYLNGSRYAFQIEQFLEHFPSKQLLVITSEQLRDERVATLAGVWSFLEVDPMPETEAFEADHNVTDGKHAPRPVVKALMATRGWKRFAAAVPDRAKSAGRRVSHAPVQSAHLSPAAREEFAAQLRDDVEQLRGHVAGPFDGWGIA